ncbi:MAG: helix-turn-helix domain-containing protein [Bacteroidota bacterium]|nr:helix-turn-helix domain-containing protein [Bacteroidota bacterium]
MMDQSDLKRFNFDLSALKPIQLIYNSHKDLDDYWFDMHYEFEVGVILSGRMKREYLDHEMILNPGEVWLCGMWEPHGFELLETPCVALVFVIDPAYVAESTFLNMDILTPFQVHPANRPQVNMDKRDTIIQLSERVLEKSDDPDWRKIFFSQLMLTLCENWQVPEGSLKSFELQNSIQQALRLVFNERRLITTREAASVCHMSETGFRNAFGRLMDCTFSEFALQYRIRGAITHLRNSNETQESIARDWGFTDASHLHKYIKPEEK